MTRGLERRAFLTAALAAGAVTAARPARAAPAAAGTAEESGWRRIELLTEVDLRDTRGASSLWLPVAQNAPAYQRADLPRWTSDGDARLVRDDRYGAPMLRVTWPATGSGGPRVVITQQVALRDRGTLDAPLSAEARAFWVAPTPSIPTDGIVRETAQKIMSGHGSPEDRLRALYDWVVDKTWRNPATPGCGTGNIRAMLRSGDFGGKCADINGLMTGLARAGGFPARDVYGVRVAQSELFPCLGHTGDVSNAQHCRSEAYVDGAGWVPLDPADVRKVVLETGRPLADPQVQALRRRLFGYWEMNWVGFNSATDLHLPGATVDQRPNFPFLMYPCAISAAGEANCLDPKGFRYRIEATPL